jgi:hypothetical protein
VERPAVVALGDLGGRGRNGARNGDAEDGGKDGGNELELHGDCWRDQSVVCTGVERDGKMRAHVVRVCGSRCEKSEGATGEVA